MKIRNNKTSYQFVFLSLHTSGADPSSLPWLKTEILLLSLWGNKANQIKLIPQSFNKCNSYFYSYFDSLKKMYLIYLSNRVWSGFDWGWIQLGRSHIRRWGNRRCSGAETLRLGPHLEGSKETVFNDSGWQNELL